MWLAFTVVAFGSVLLACAFSLTSHSDTLSCYYRGDPRRRNRQMLRLVGFLCRMLACQSTKEGLETLAVGFAVVGVVLLSSPAVYMVIMYLFSLVTG